MLLGLGTLGLAIAGALSMNNTNETEYTTDDNDKELELGEATYEYFMSLGYPEQEDYFKSNKYLSMYLDREYYPNSKEYTARGAARIARMYNREFTNRNNIY
jgi:hypothetical protein